MDQFLNSIWSENLYPAKVKLLKLAKEQRPEIKPKDVEDFLNGQISYQLLSLILQQECFTNFHQCALMNLNFAFKILFSLNLIKM